MALIDIGKQQNLNKKQISKWVDLKDKEDSFTALHFASCRGNVDMCEQLI